MSFCLLTDPLLSWPDGLYVELWAKTNPFSIKLLLKARTYHFKTTGKQEEWALMLAGIRPFLLSVQFAAPSHETLLPTFKVCLLYSLKPLWKHLHIPISLLGDSKSSQVDNEDEPLHLPYGVQPDTACTQKAVPASIQLWTEGCLLLP